MNKTELKKELAERFERLYKGKRLLAVQLDGFTHRIIFNEKKGAPIQAITFSFYTCINEATHDRALLFFRGLPHHNFQNNAQEIVYILPKNA